jgi:hypothetical protein
VTLVVGYTPTPPGRAALVAPLPLPGNAISRILMDAHAQFSP